MNEQIYKILEEMNSNVDRMLEILANIDRKMDARLANLAAHRADTAGPRGAWQIRES